MFDKRRVVQQAQVGRAELGALPAPSRVRAEKNDRARAAAFDAQESHTISLSSVGGTFMEKTLPLPNIFRNLFAMYLGVPYFRAVSMRGSHAALYA
jgi:hypothetical protein